MECVPRIHKQDKLREARKLKRKKYLDEIDFPSLLEHFQAICVLNKLIQIKLLNMLNIFFYQEVVSRHQMSRRKERASAILAKGVQNLNLPSS